VEVAAIVNAIPHGLLIERVDPPKEDIRASYAFSNSLSKKVVTCKLTTLTRSGARGGGSTKKVVCRVGGGQRLIGSAPPSVEGVDVNFVGRQDLQLYMLNRQAGM
jgi:hypothetical protein